MRSFALAATTLLLASSAVCAEKSKPLSSKNIFSATFTPPAAFSNINLVHTINLEKAYPKESINVVIENIDSQPQNEYYIPFTPVQMENIGGLEVRDRKDPDLGLFDVQAVEFDTESEIQYYKVTLPKSLAPKTQQTLSITYSYLSILYPLPAAIGQADQQYLVYEFSAYWPSAYTSQKQKTEVKFPNPTVPDYTIIPASGSTPESPQKASSKFTYGTFNEVPAGSSHPVRVRYEFTKPLIHVSRLERDIEVSHWGGNVAFEDRYTLHNHAANLSAPFNRVQWAQTQYYNPPSTAIRELKFPLKVGSLTPYFTDVIGNVSTSRFRSNKREANLEIKPRYPIFGGWNYPFRIGYDADSKNFLRTVKGGNGYVLKVPFLEGPKQSEGVEYKVVELRIILPEGATITSFHTTVPITSSTEVLHKTFMDTLGRTTLILTARNIVDELRDREIIVTYDYTFMAGMRKPLSLAGLVTALFGAAYILGSLDTKIVGKARS